MEIGLKIFILQVNVRSFLLNTRNAKYTKYRTTSHGEEWLLEGMCHKVTTTPIEIAKHLHTWLLANTTREKHEITTESSCVYSDSSDKELLEQLNCKLFCTIEVA